MDRFLRVLLASFAPLLFLSGVFLAGCDGAYEGFFSEADSALVTGTHNDDWSEASGALSDHATTASLQGSSVVITKGESGTLVYSERVSDAVITDEQKPRTITGGMPRYSPFMKKLAFFLACSLLFAACMTAGFKRFASRKEEEPEEEKRPDLKLKLEKIKDLLPIAEKLALAVDLPGAYDLVATVHQNVKDAVLEKKDGAALSMCYSNALSALRTLQRSAIEQADSIFGVSRSLAELPSLGPWGAETSNVMLKLEISAKCDTVRALFKTFRSLEESSVTLSRRFREKAQELSLLRNFENERDKELLLVAANALEEIRVTGAYRSHLAAFMQEVSNSVLEGLKVLFVEDLGIRMRQMEIDLDAIRVPTALAVSAEEQGDDDSFSKLSTEIKERLGVLLADVTAASRLLLQMGADAEEVQKGATMQAVVAAGQKALAADKRVRALLQKWKGVVANLPSLPKKIDATTRELLDKIANRAWNNIISDNAALAAALRETQEATKELAFVSAAPPGERISFKVAGASELGTKGARRVAASSVIARALKVTNDSDAALGHLRELDDHAVWQTAAKGAAQRLRLGARLLVLLDSDLQHTRAIVNHAASHISDVHKEKFAGLQELFDAAKDAAKDASNLEEAAEAAANMRYYALAMEELVYADDTQAAKDEGHSLFQ